MLVCQADIVHVPAVAELAVLRWLYPRLSVIVWLAGWTRPAALRLFQQSSVLRHLCLSSVLTRPAFGSANNVTSHCSQLQQAAVAEAACAVCFQACWRTVHGQYSCWTLLAEWERQRPCILHTDMPSWTETVMLCSGCGP